MGLCAACGAELRRPGSLGRRDHAAAPGGPVPRSCFGPARRRLPAGRRAGDAERVPALPAADTAGEVRWARRRAAGPAFSGAVPDVAAWPGPAHGRGGTRPGSAAGSPGTTCPSATRPRPNPAATSTARWLARPLSARRGRPRARRSRSPASSPREHDLDLVGQIPEGEPVLLRELLVHVIEEYTHHDGHTDLLQQAHRRAHRPVEPRPHQAFKKQGPDTIPRPNTPDQCDPARGPACRRAHCYGPAGADISFPEPTTRAQAGEH